jgi:hypothetical protein
MRDKTVHLSPTVRTRYVSGVAFIVGITLKAASDLMAWHDLFGVQGAVLAIAASVALFLSALFSVRLGISVTIVVVGNAILHYWVVQKLLEYSDVFGTDPWLTLGFWIWTAAAACCLVRVTIAYIKAIHY